MQIMLSCKKCWTAELIEACEGLRALDRCTNCVNAATPLPLHGICVRYGGNWMAQTLGNMLINWLLIVHGWLRLSSQALHGARPICFMDTYS